LSGTSSHHITCQVPPPTTSLARYLLPPHHLSGTSPHYITCQVPPPTGWKVSFIITSIHYKQRNFLRMLRHLFLTYCTATLTCSESQPCLSQLRKQKIFHSQAIFENALFCANKKIQRKRLNRSKYKTIAKQCNEHRRGQGRAMAPLARLKWKYLNKNLSKA